MEALGRGLRCKGIAQRGIERSGEDMPIHHIVNGYSFVSSMTSLYKQALASLAVCVAVATPPMACDKPKPGTYWLGWGTARLVVPSKGRPYQYFRNDKYDLPGKYCLSGDNVGVVRTEPNGKTWAYTPITD